MKPGDVCGFRVGNYKQGVTEEFTLSELGDGVHYVEFMLRKAGLQPDGTRQPPRTVRIDLAQLLCGRLALNVFDGAGMTLRPCGNTLVLEIQDGESPVRGNG